MITNALFTVYMFADYFSSKCESLVLQCNCQPRIWAMVMINDHLLHIQHRN